ncbi:MAG: DUF1223 domain-containing protein, partial [Sediminibacterium sp.]|nr:DUF1223 domain-containing protein [Sediminibacterium sp.]
MIYSFFIWISALLNLYTFGFESNNKSIQNTSPNYVLVELFTSEGCSSCPPAETLIHELQKQYVDKPVIFLEYHVDYWNYLGWLDSFSSEKNTLRQQQYASWFNISDIYTPQAIINGTFQMVGSNKSQLQSTI